MATVRQTIQRDLAARRLVPASPLTDVRGIGSYIEGRLRRALRRNAPLTIQTFWTSMRPKSTDRVTRVLYRALQNERGNQCVSSRVSGQRRRKTYHTGDVNQHGYEACVTLLNYQRTHDQGVQFGVLPTRLPQRGSASKGCGCRSRRNCVGECALTGDGACVPRAHNARGFVGVTSHPDQSERTTDGVRVRRQSATRLTNALRNDPHSARDMAAGHSRQLRYSARGTRLWRRPGSKVRLNVL